MPLQATSGAASYDAFGGGVPVVPAYIEEVFSTYLYTGTGASQTITNNIDLSTKGGLVWQKDRSQGTGYHHILQDTARGATNCLFTNLTNAQSQDGAGTGFVFNNNGFTIGSTNVKVNASGDNYASWTFRKQPKFFDVVTYTGDGIAGKTINHNLGSTPGFIIVKGVDVARAWFCYHSSLGPTKYIRLDDTGAAQTDSTYWNDTAPTSTQFTVGGATGTNFSGYQFVAYLFAHDAGGFGLTGTDNVISCGSFTVDAGGLATIDLGYEPQWVMFKNASVSDAWFMSDNMRAFCNSVDGTRYLLANSSNAEGANANWYPTATGAYFDTGYASGNTCIYIAIRRGPMKVPTSGTSVLGLNARTGTDANATVTGGLTADATIIKNNNSVAGALWASRLTANGYLQSNGNNTEATSALVLQANPWDVMDGVKVGTTSTITNASTRTYINYLFKRAPSFMDTVCYTGTGANATQTHNLQAVPELIIVKRRDVADNWAIYSSALANTEYLVLTSTAAKATGATWWNSTTATSSVFSIGTSTTTNASAGTYVAYLFSTCAGVSKVGSYTGTGATQTISCGFTGGARFVMVKRTDSTGAWYVWDTARGMVSGTDPSFLLNTTAAEVNADSIYTTTGGFQIVSTVAAINASGGTYIFLAIA